MNAIESPYNERRSVALRTRPVTLEWFPGLQRIHEQQQTLTMWPRQKSAKCPTRPMDIEGLWEELKVEWQGSWWSRGFSWCTDSWFGILHTRQVADQMCSGKGNHDSKWWSPKLEGAVAVCVFQFIWTVMGNVSWEFLQEEGPGLQKEGLPTHLGRWGQPAPQTSRGSQLLEAIGALAEGLFINKEKHTWMLLARKGD